MKEHYILKQICCLLLSLAFFTSCNGQDRAKQKQAGANKSKTIPVGQPKIKKPTDRHQDDNIHSGLQDKAGNIWFCTSGEGVYRYDGKLFTNFTENDGLNSNAVWCMLEDKNGIIWFGTDSGICRYDPSAVRRTGSKIFTRIPIVVAKSGNFIPYTSSNAQPSTNCAVWSILQDKSGKFWFGTKEDGVYCYNPSAERGTGSILFTHFLDNDGVINKDNLHPKWVDCILEDKAGNIWLASGPLSSEGVYRYDGASIISFNPKGDKWVRSILEDKNGNLLFVTRHEGVCRYDPSAAQGSSEVFSNITQRGGLDNWSITSIFEDKAGNLWFGEDRGNNTGTYEGGLWRYDPSAALRTGSKAFTRYTTKDGLSNNGVWCIIEDRAGNIWAASRCNGVSRYDRKTFTNFTE